MTHEVFDGQQVVTQCLVQQCRGATQNRYSQTYAVCDAAAALCSYL